MILHQNKYHIRKICHRRNMQMNYFGASLIIVLYQFATVLTHDYAHERCTAKILRKHPDAVCYTVNDAKSCNGKCKQRADIDCKGKTSTVRKLQCKMRIGYSKVDYVEVSNVEHTNKAPTACCCLVRCKEEVGIPIVQSKCYALMSNLF